MSPSNKKNHFMNSFRLFAFQSLLQLHKLNRANRFNSLPHHPNPILTPGVAPSRCSHACHRLQWLEPAGIQNSAAFEGDKTDCLMKSKSISSVHPEMFALDLGLIIAKKFLLTHGWLSFQQAPSRFKHLFLYWIHYIPGCKVAAACPDFSPRRAHWTRPSWPLR